MVGSVGSRADTYLNPVYPKSFPDPFVLKFNGEYFAYSTGFAPDGNVFAVVKSHDLVNWTEVGGAMEPLDSSPPYYWAPEVTYDNGTFYLYYSTGNETLMELRVAVSDRPNGGFVDSGKRLTSEEFAIDAHIFIDDDGQKYMFYATDFLEHTNIGTGTVVDRMIDWLTLAGNPTPVTRAKYDWQVYDPARKEKGGVRWHTVEGPAVLKRKGLYYEMFSGGNWKNTTYGVSFGMSDTIDSPNEWRQFSDGENVLPILRTIPDEVIGPGHNCVVRGPNNRELYCVYHRWSETDRVMAIDRMDFAGERIFVIGPTNVPQPRPTVPAIQEGFRGPQISRQLSFAGDWSFTDQGAVGRLGHTYEASINPAPESFLFETTWSWMPSESPGHLGVRIGMQTGAAILEFDPERSEASFMGCGAAAVIHLHQDFVWRAPHTLRIEVNVRRVSIQVDDRSKACELFLDSAVTDLRIQGEGGSLLLSHVDVTEGFEELFETAEPLELNGWTVRTEGRYAVARGELLLDPGSDYRMTKGPGLGSLELAANFRAFANSGGSFGLILSNESGDEFRIGINCTTRSIEMTGAPEWPLPDAVELSQYHQIRILRTAGTVTGYFDDVRLGDFTIAPGDLAGALFSEGGGAAIEMIRLTAI